MCFILINTKSQTNEGTKISKVQLYTITVALIIVYKVLLFMQAPCYVSWIIRGSPAEQIGLIVGDNIISVNGADVSEASHEDVVKLIGNVCFSIYLYLF